MSETTKVKAIARHTRGLLLPKEEVKLHQPCLRRELMPASITRLSQWMAATTVNISRAVSLLTNDALPMVVETASWSWPVPGWILAKRFLETHML